MAGYRLPAGGLIDRDTAMSFSFEGKTYKGFSGDTLASALLANGIGTVARSFKYHRPRGLLCAGVDEPNAVVGVGADAHATPNQKATTVELYDGLESIPTNAWPSLAFDLLAVNSVFGRFLPSGFYYKTFKWPNWSLYEPSIRRAAGLGVSPDAPDPDTYDKQFAECEILVVGSGPAGLAAALVAAKAGARVFLAEQDSRWGGTLLWRDTNIDGRSGKDWAAAAVAELEQHENVTLLGRTTAFGYYDHNLVGLRQKLTEHMPPGQRRGPRERLWKVRAGKVVLATGALERPLIFPNNDRPGVMLAGAGVEYACRYAAAPGRRIVIAGNNSLIYEYARLLSGAGCTVCGVVDSRHDVTPDISVLPSGATFQSGAVITNVDGKPAVRAVEIHRADADGKPVSGERHVIECDALLTSGGLSPAVHLFSQSGGRLTFDEGLQAFRSDQSVQHEVSVGAAAGHFDLNNALRDAAMKTAAIQNSETGAASDVTVSRATNVTRYEVAPHWHTNVESLARNDSYAFVDFQNDVTSADIGLAIRENFRSVEHVKRYTTLGMATDQGKTSNVNGIGVMAAALAKPLSEVGTTRFRPPYDPVSFGAIAGRQVGSLLAPQRRLAAHEHHVEAGAKLEDYGPWLRPAYYPGPGEREEAAISREVVTVRKHGGMFEGSPLGKIEVYGPDAAEFLNRIYVNNLKSLQPGRCRYGIMLTENGIVYDDGVVARISQDHFLVGTTSGQAAGVAAMLQEWLQCEYVDMDVVTQDVTTGWAVINVAGIHAREIVSGIESDIDFSPAAFQHMDFKSGILGGVPARIQRVSFTGELSYEVSVPWRYGKSLWKAYADLGAEFGITPFGIQSLEVLRLEKGFLHVGADTDGMTYPQDVGFANIIAKKESDFAGRRSTMRPDAVRRGRPQLVGLATVDSKAALPIGAHIVSTEDADGVSEGYVTSSAWSPNLERAVALGLVRDGTTRMGETVIVRDLGNYREARIVQPGGFDPQGERFRA